jgi:hypothetical protein
VYQIGSGGLERIFETGFEPVDRVLPTKSKLAMKSARTKQRAYAGCGPVNRVVAECGGTPL